MNDFELNVSKKYGLLVFKSDKEPISIDNIDDALSVCTSNLIKVYRIGISEWLHDLMLKSVNECSSDKSDCAEIYEYRQIDLNVNKKLNKHQIEFVVKLKDVYRDMWW
jgi:hypothetical protein